MRGSKSWERRETRRIKKKAGPETARTRTMSPITITLREPARDGAVRDIHLGGNTQALSSSRLLQEILDVLLPTSVALEIGGASHAPSLEEAGGVSFLKRH